MVVWLIIAPFSSRLPAMLAVSGRFLTVVCLIFVSAFPSITSLRVFPGFIAKPFRGVELVLRSRIFESCSPPNFPHFCLCGSSGWASVMVRPWKAGNYLKNRSLVRFRIVWVAFCKRDNHDMRRARAMQARLWEQ